eukprot:scaffold12518_cov75-Cyclotella_meneghiniana.AAC.3
MSDRNSKQDSNQMMGKMNKQSSSRETTPEPMDQDHTPNRKSDIRISSQDVAVQLLARLDDQAYQQAIGVDANQINENYLMPLSFPWRQGVRLPNKARKAMPRDIDDLHATTHCDDYLTAPFGDFNGPLGQGRFENGQSRGHYGLRLSTMEAGSLSVESNSIAVARRSQDPGVLELSVQMPLPSSTACSKLTPQEWNERLSKESQYNAEALSHLPYTWRKKNHNGGDSAKIHGTLNESNTKTSEAPAEDAFIRANKTRAKQERDFSLACIRKWNISTKVEGVSSRRSIFPFPILLGSMSSDKSKQRVVRPMLCNAILPEEVQIGISTSLEQAEKERQRLGSYDCRFTDKILNLKKDSSSKSKRVTAGRTRLVWSNVIQGEEPYSLSTQNQVAYNSLISGRRIDQIARPRDVKVCVRLKGRVLLEEAIEDASQEVAVNANSRKRKHSTRLSENQTEKRHSIQVPEFRTDTDLNDALAFSLDRDGKVQSVQEKRLLTRSTSNGAKVYLNVTSTSSNQIDHNEIISLLVKFNMYRKAKQNDIQAMASLSINNYALPRFAMLPLDGGVLHHVCVSSGKLAATSVHKFLCDASKSDSAIKCSVCWSDEGQGLDGVCKCSTCGLLVHRNCCLDKGQITPHSNVINGVSGDSLDGQHEQWQCAVCSKYTDKTRRKSRLPSRFTVDMVQEQSKEEHLTATNGDSKNAPGPRCTLCPHRGGAMSLLGPENSQIWAHEVCRVWSNAETPENKELANHPFQKHSKVSSSACAICGGSGQKKGKSHCTGLTKCAAPGCYIAFHPMCALLASKVDMSDQNLAVSSRKTRLSIEQIDEEKKSEDEKEDDTTIRADEKLCKEYTLQLVTLPNSEKTIPVAFCGLHNPGRGVSCYGRLPGEVG